ncbi:MAG: coenzyme F430 synthase [Methanosphaera sp.]|nr:coenzyme F430 synthase [Methanosphaera sp.]
MTKNILISDANHGGITLLREYSKYSDDKLYFYDTYNKLTSSMKKEYSSTYNVEFLDLAKINDNRDKYVVVNPVHMRDVFSYDYTHHEFTGYLINKHRLKYGWNFKLIEVTGVKGKTTTVHLISSILRDHNCLILCSEGLVYHSLNRSTTLRGDISITPASIITSLNIARDENLLDEIEYFICEVSLGITSNCDIGVLTNIVEDYPIADNKRCASGAKKSVFSSNTVICDYDAYNTYYRDMVEDNITTVSLNNNSSDVYTISIDYSLDQTTIRVSINKEEFIVKAYALSDFYVNNILLAITVALKLGIPIKSIISNVESINSINGRNSRRYIDNKIVFEDINSGLNTTAIKKCVNNLNRYSDNHMIIIGGDYGVTCEEIDEEKLSSYLETISNDNIILAGDVGYNIKDRVNNNYRYYKNLADAFNYARCSNIKVIQVIYRSRYGDNIEYLEN